jgi:phage I-like protein
MGLTSRVRNAVLGRGAFFENPERTSQTPLFERSSQTRLLAAFRKSSPTASHGATVCALAIEGDDAPEWLQIIPAGKFNAADGRGPFFNSNPQAVVEASKARMPSAGLVLDYDHSTDFAAPEGRPAPAAAWIKEFAVRGGAIFARIEWTEEGAAAVKAKKYRYISPVFDFERPDGAPEGAMTGTVTRILHGALTNNPALIKLPAIAAANRGAAAMADENDNGGAEGTSLSEIVAGLERLFPEMPKARILQIAMEACGDGDEDDAINAGDGADPYANESEEQMAARQAEEMADCASDGERAELAQRHAEQMEACKMRSSGTAASASNLFMRTSQTPFSERSSQPVAPLVTSERQVLELVAKHPMMVATQKELAKMRAQQAKQDAEAAVDAAIKAGKLIPAQREWAIAYCSADRAGFDKFIGAQPTIVAAGADGTFTARPAGVSPDDTLTNAERAICAQTRTTPEEYLKRKKELAAMVAQQPANVSMFRFEIERASK